MKLVIIESPLGTKPDGTRCTAEEMAENQRYARACMLDSLRRGEAPFASHVLYPLVLDDATPEERRMGMEAGFAWGHAAWLAAGPSDTYGEFLATVAVYVDRGVTSGMRAGIERHKDHRDVSIEERRLGGEWELAEAQAAPKASEASC